MSDTDKKLKSKLPPAQHTTSEDNWNSVFNRRKKTEAEKFDEAIMKNEYYDLDKDQ